MRVISERWTSKRPSGLWANTTSKAPFWVVNPTGKYVKVYHRATGTVTYRDGDRISLALFGSDLEVNAIFQ